MTKRYDIGAGRDNTLQAANTVKRLTRSFDGYIIEQIAFQSEGYEIVGWVMRPSGRGPYPVVVYNHGSRISHYGDAHLERPTLSFSTRPWPGVSAGKCLLFFPEGRGYAGSEGPKLTECTSELDLMAFLQGRADDVSAGIDWLADQTWANTSRIGLTGCSHGAVVSLLAAPSGQYLSVIAQAPGASIHRPATGMEQMANAIMETHAPILLQHAEDDTLCPAEALRTLYQLGKQADRDISLIIYPAVP